VYNFISLIIAKFKVDDLDIPLEEADKVLTLADKLPNDRIL
jgi:hypothetical protein